LKKLITSKNQISQYFPLELKPNLMAFLTISEQADTVLSTVSDLAMHSHHTTGLMCLE
jgi:hypothetical protein